MSCNPCVFYVAGLLVVFAYDDISHNKIATQSHTFMSTDDRYDARKVVDGNLATCMRTKEIGRNSPDETVWWKVDLGGVFNIYRINILFKNYEGYDIRQKGRFAGFSLYISNTGDIKGSTLCYKDVTKLPLLNFTTTCTEFGRYVIFYNERLNGVAYPIGYEVTSVITELCEVTVQGCNNASVYGSNCDTPCPISCKNSMCHIQNGTCFECKPGWTGVYCDTKCREGWYGMNCNQWCVGHCKDVTTCNHVTGQCDRGCDTGWTGSLCDKGCDNNTYGYDCINNCSGHCLNNFPCNKQTGHCDRGCNPGYTNKYCSTECSLGQFGLDCRERCSKHCKNSKPCDHINGACTSGCQDGFVGSNCTNTCEEGYFGTHCSRICSPYCKPGTCRHTDGSCTLCAEGWTGYNCTTACVQSYGENCRKSCSPHCYNRTCDRFNGRCHFGCKYGFYGEMCERDRTENLLLKQDTVNCISLVIGLSISILINLFLIGCGILLYRRRTSSSVTFNDIFRPCWKKSIYQDIVVKTEEASTYQEINLSESAYQNTTMR